MIDNFTKYSWKVFPMFMIILIIILGVKAMSFVFPYTYPFELIACGVIAMPLVVLIIFFKIMHRELNNGSD